MERKKPLRHVGLVSGEIAGGYSGCVQLEAYVPPSLPDSELAEVAAEHTRALAAFYALSGSELTYAQFLLQTRDTQIAECKAVLLLRRQQVSRAAHRVTAVVAGAFYEHFFQELAASVVRHVRKPPYSFVRTRICCDDTNLGLAIGVQGCRVKSVKGSFTWDCERPLSAAYVLSLPPEASAAHAEDVYEEFLPSR